MSVPGFVPSTLRMPGPGAALALPPAPAPPPRASIPWLASVVPVVGALGFWALTGSTFALWFAVLGPLIAVAGVADGVRTARRERRRAERTGAEARQRLCAQIDEHHALEREELGVRHPDAAGLLTRREAIWRHVPERDGTIVIGRGEAQSLVSITAPADAGAADRALAAEARRLVDAPVAVPLGAGIAVVGPVVAAEAVVRALVLQLALAFPPGRMEVVGEGWVRELPHAQVRAASRVIVGESDEVAGEDDALVLSARPGAPLPPRCAVVLTLTGIGEGTAEAGAETRAVAVEAFGEAQAQAVAVELAERFRSAAARPGGDDAPLALTRLRTPERRRGRAGLPVAIGMAGGRPFEVDLVRDGPHAVVTGMTGAGKSELLVTWVLALCATYRTDDVSFLLADFKGGTSFDALAALPHVTGVITDLDTRVARRAIESLRAEIRHREAVLARAGARDVAEVDLARLVIVVDEFAALRETQPEFEALFADIAARGRALGLHLVLGTQRATGAVREGLMANCPLRISLRVADRLDSRAVIGTDDAADLPGDEAGRGRAMIRRGADAHPHRVRIALSGSDDLVFAGHDAGAPPRAPWLPALAPAIALDAVRGDADGIVLGIVDDPEHQRQSPWRLDAAARGLLVVGGAGAGKSTALRTVAAQVPVATRIWIGADPEQAWDALSRATAAPPGTTVLIDDLDLVVARFPDDHARAAGEAIERLIREAGSRGLRIVAAAHRLTGVAGRAADLFPHRLILATAGRAEHVAAGGDAADHALCTDPGRGVIAGLAVQVAHTSDPVAVPPVDAPVWAPAPGVSGFVTRHGARARERWERTGVRLRAVDDPADAGDDAEPVVLVGAPEQWLARPRVWERIRAAHAIVVDAACERDLRLLTSERNPPPYADPARGRGWLFRGDEPPRRVTVDPIAGS